MDPTAAPNINILSFKNQDQTSLGRFLTWSLRYGRIIIIITEFLVIAAFISRFYFDRQLADLHDQIDSKAVAISGNQGFEKQFLALQSSVATVGAIIDTRKNFANLLAGLVKTKPQGLVIQDITIKGPTINLVCQVASPAVLNEFLQNVTQTGKLSDISIDDISSKDVALVVTMSATLTDTAFK